MSRTPALAGPRRKPTEWRKLVIWASALIACSRPTRRTTPLALATSRSVASTDIPTLRASKIALRMKTSTRTVPQHSGEWSPITSPGLPASNWTTTPAGMRSSTGILRGDVTTWSWTPGPFADFMRSTEEQGLELRTNLRTTARKNGPATMTKSLP